MVSRGVGGREELNLLWLRPGRTKCLSPGARGGGVSRWCPVVSLGRRAGGRGVPMVSRGVPPWCPDEIDSEIDSETESEIDSEIDS